MERMVIMDMGKKYLAKGMAVALAVVMALSTFAPMPAYAASKKMAVEVKSPKKGVKLSGTKLAVHVKKPVRLVVKYGGRDVSAKASYESSKPGVVSVSKNGRLSVKKNGRAAVTVKYKGTAKKVTVTVSKHKWKAHKASKVINGIRYRCGCGEMLRDIEEKYCKECQVSYVFGYLGLCQCKRMEHYDNCTSEKPYKQVKCKKKVKYTDYYQCSCGMRKAGEPEPKDEY